MPSKIKSKLLIVTVFCATLAILFLIAPATAEMYSLILLGVSLLMATLAGFNARETVELQYKVSSFITLAVFIFVGMTRPSIDYETDFELPNKAERQIKGFVFIWYGSFSVLSGGRGEAGGLFSACLPLDFEWRMGSS